MRAHAALDKLQASEECGMPRGIVLSRLNIELDDKVVYLPWYPQFFLEDVLLPDAELPKVTLPKIYVPLGMLGRSVRASCTECQILK